MECLISGQPLEEIVKLSCGHTYNYEPLFKEVFNQKINPNFKNDAIRLKVNEFKCPYCRKIQSSLLDNKVPVYGVSTLNSDYEIDPKVCYNLDQFYLFKLGNCVFPNCTKKYVFKRSVGDLCCLHIRTTKRDLNKITPIETEAEKAFKLAEKAKEKEAAKVAKAAQKVAEKEAIKVAKAAEKEAIKVAKAAQKAAEKEAIKIAKAAEKAKTKSEKPK